MATPSCVPCGNIRPCGSGAGEVGAGWLVGSGLVRSSTWAGLWASGALGGEVDGCSGGCLEGRSGWFARHGASWSVGRML